MERDPEIFGKKPAVPKEVPVRRANPLIRRPFKAPGSPDQSPKRPIVVPVKKPDLVPVTR